MIPNQGSTPTVTVNNGPQGAEWGVGTNTVTSVNLGSTPVNFVTTEGSDIRVEVPSAIGAELLNGILVDNSTFTNQQFGSAIIQLSLFDPEGNEINDFGNEAVEICFTKPSNEKDACLGYYDERNNDWVCEDRCPKTTNSLIW